MELLRNKLFVGLRQDKRWLKAHRVKRVICVGPDIVATAFDQKHRMDVYQGIGHNTVLPQMDRSSSAYTGAWITYPAVKTHEFVRDAELVLQVVRCSLRAEDGGGVLVCSNSSEHMDEVLAYGLLATHEETGEPLDTLIEQHPIASAWAKKMEAAAAMVL